MRVGIIGPGTVGTTLGRRFAESGHAVTYGSRNPGGAAPHAGAQVASVRGAVEASEVIVLTTPWDAAPDALASAGDFAGRTLIDATNPIGPRLQLAVGHTTSGAEELAKVARGAKVVKGFNTTGVENMANPRYGSYAVMMPMAGDDAAALEKAVQLARSIGFDAYGLEGLQNARNLEPLALLWIRLAIQLGQGRSNAFVWLRRTEIGERPKVPRTTAPKSITIVGAGNMGGALARGWLAAGHRVTLAVRDVAGEDVKALTALGAKAQGAAGAAQDADVVVLAIPFGAVASTASQLGALAGKVVIDCTNAIAPGMQLRFGLNTSSAEELAKTLPGARVVRAFNQQGAEVLENPRFGDATATQFVAGDDDDARSCVLALSRDLALDAIDVGSLSNARLLEPMTLFWIGSAGALDTREIGLTWMRRS
jgi:predicted dinucleotide-binding enzyme